MIIGTCKCTGQVKVGLNKNMVAYGNKDCGLQTQNTGKKRCVFYHVHFFEKNGKVVPYFITRHILYFELLFSSQHKSSVDNSQGIQIAQSC